MALYVVKNAFAGYSVFDDLKLDISIPEVCFAECVAMIMDARAHSASHAFKEMTLCRAGEVIPIRPLRTDEVGLSVGAIIVPVARLRGANVAQDLARFLGTDLQLSMQMNEASWKAAEEICEAYGVDEATSLRAVSQRGAGAVSGRNLAARGKLRELQQTMRLRLVSASEV